MAPVTPPQTDRRPDILSGSVPSVNRIGRFQARPALQNGQLSSGGGGEIPCPTGPSDIGLSFLCFALREYLYHLDEQCDDQRSDDDTDRAECQQATDEPHEVQCR